MLESLPRSDILPDSAVHTFLPATPSPGAFESPPVHRLVIPESVFSSFRRSCLFFFTGRFSTVPCTLAWQYSATGHTTHFGAPFGTHIIAPSSINAWLNVPDLLPGITFKNSFSTFVFTDCFKISLSSSMILAYTRRTFPSTAGTGDHMRWMPPPPAV